MSIDPETFRHEPADTIHGQLQRGRGAGYLGALELPQAEAHRMLIDCITRDPRLDSQVEERTGYYAALAHRLVLPLEPLATHLRRSNDPEQSCWTTSLTLEVLGSLARRGNSAAVKILRDYVEWGLRWDDAVRELAASADPSVWTGLDQVMCSRFPDIERLENALDWFRADDPAWVNWEKSNPIIAKLVDRDRSRTAGYQVEKVALAGRGLSVAALLAEVNEENGGCFRRDLRKKVRIGDSGLLLANLSPDRPFAAGAALAGLEALALPEFFEPLLAFWKVCPDKPRWLRGSCRGALAALPSTKVHELGCQWLNSTNKEERWLAERILDNHGNSEDVPLLRAAIAGCLEDEYKHLYRLCSLIDAFMNMPNHGSVPELERAFVECRYSYARKRAAWAMNETAPGKFQKTYGCECFWDCESDTRELGCKVADTRLPECRHRLHELVDDPFEEEEVRTAAKRRLDDGSHR